MEDIDYAAKAKERRMQIHANIGHTLCEFRKDAGYSLWDRGQSPVPQKLTTIHVYKKKKH